MTNSRYLAIMDLAALELMARLGLLRAALRRRWRPVLGATFTTHRRSLRPFDRYEISARVVYWDARWSYLEHRFERDGELVAVGLSKCLFLGQQGAVPLAEVLAELGLGAAEPPALPDAVRLWIEAEERLASLSGQPWGEAQTGLARRDRKVDQEAPACLFG
jgi:acyl-CoA thioesterase FadM